MLMLPLLRKEDAAVADVLVVVAEPDAAADLDVEVCADLAQGDKKRRRTRRRRRR